MNFWLSVSRGSRRRGATSVNWTMPSGELLSSDIRNRLLSRVKVIADSFRAQRGLPSVPVMRVNCRRVPDTESSITMSP